MMICTIHSNHLEALTPRSVFNFLSAWLSLKLRTSAPLSSRTFGLSCTSSQLIIVVRLYHLCYESAITSARTSLSAIRFISENRAITLHSQGIDFTPCFVNLGLLSLFHRRWPSYRSIADCRHQGSRCFAQAFYVTTQGRRRLQELAEVHHFCEVPTV
jgi:hypothetical protein